MYRTTYSVAMCCASAALPPLPQKYSVPPCRTVSRTISSARSSAGPSWSTTRCAAAARSRSGAENASDTLRHEPAQRVDAVFGESRELRLPSRRLARALERESGERVDREQLTRVLTREATVGDQRGESATHGREAQFRRSRDRPVGIAAE